MRILYVDPGKRWCGCAHFWDYGPSASLLLDGSALIKGPNDREGPEQWRGMASAVKGHHAIFVFEKIVIEVPDAYRSDAHWKTKDLQDLVGVAAWIWALFPEAEPILVRPREWQGSLKRDKRHPGDDPVVQRIKGRLSAQELNRIELPCRSLATNVWDSVGIGLWHLGRLEPRRVIIRG